LLKGLNVPRLQLVGYEGVWGTSVMMIVFLVMYIVPGRDAGSYENSLDSLVKIQSSGDLRYAIALYTFSCMSYNLCAVCVTGALSAVHRTMFMALRTLIVWIVDLAVHYLINPKSSWGESWSSYSFLELFGFLVLVTGQAIYAGVVQVPGLNYAASPAIGPSAQNYQSPAAMKMDSPCLPQPEDEVNASGAYIALSEEA